MVFFQTVFADAPVLWQKGFQDPATSSMEAIIDRHHDVNFFRITIRTLVMWMGFRIRTHFHYTVQTLPEKINHHTNLELVWAILPSLIIIRIALPSLTLIYSFDDHVEQPDLTIKVIGRQWYWSYEMQEHVQYTLAAPTLLRENEL